MTSERNATAAAVADGTQPGRRQVVRLVFLLFWMLRVRLSKKYRTPLAPKPLAA